VAKKERDSSSAQEMPLEDLAARIGGAGHLPVETPAAPPAPDGALPPRLDGPLPPRRTETRPAMIGMNEPIAPAPPAPVAEEEAPKSGAIQSPRTVPGPGETDVVATPLPTLDDWHRFELALRRVRGVGQVRTEYYRHGVLKVRVGFEGTERLSQALRDGIPGYRVRILGEDRSTVQILVSSEGGERRSG